MIYLRQSTASQEIPLGYFVDSTDGNTEETALSIANTDIKIWKTGATTLANKNLGGATHISNGIYYAVLDATDTDTIGPLRIFVHVTGALAVKVDCCVLDEAVYDAMFGTVALATATNITAGTITTATNVTTVNGLAAGVITAASIAADAITAAKVAADVGVEIAGAVWDEAQINHTTAGSFGEVATETGAIKTKTDALPTDPADASDVAAAIAALNDLSAAQVNAEVVDALSTDTYAEPTGVPGATLALSAKISWLFMALRNGLTVTSSKKTFLDDGGLGEWSKALSDDGTTYTEGEANVP